MRMSRVVLALCLVLAGCSSATTGVRPLEAVAVSKMQLNLTTWVYEPAAAGKYPLVIFVHGYTGRPQDHDRLFRAWAKAGFIVAAPAMAKTVYGANPLDIEDLINQPAAASETLTQVLAR